MSTTQTVPSGAELWWLGCLLDSEGSIYMTKYIIKNERRCHYELNICITNTNTDLMTEAIRILGKLGIIRKLTPYPYKNHPEFKPAYQIRFSGHQDVRSFLSLMLPYLIAKRKLAEVAIDFVSRRIAVAQTHHGVPPYDGSEEGYYQSIKALNGTNRTQSSVINDSRQRNRQG
jgi:hypothetical protein